MKQLIFSFILLLLIFAFSEFYLVPNHVYFFYHWLDMPVHLIGGAVVALFYISLNRYKHRPVSFYELLIFMFLVSFVWEGYEYISDILKQGFWDNGWFDTIKDTVFGYLGAVSVYEYLNRIIKRNHE